jgi:ABC-2 type transport system ATP-binding protein
LTRINVPRPICAKVLPMQRAGSPDAAEQATATDVARDVVAVRELTRRFGTLVAVDHVSFAVGHNEVFGIIGANGAGKSTIIRMLTTLLPVSSGSAEVAGFDVVREPAQVRRHIGYVPQLLSADGSLTAWENMLLSARLYGIPRGEVRPRIENALAAMELTQSAHRLVQGFSGGMIRRLEIAQSMLHRPDVLFLDEPTVGLDPVARRAVLQHLAWLRRETNTTILVTSHYMEEIDELCDRIGVLREGALAAIGAPAELKARVGPTATLDDVFAALAGAGTQTTETEGYRGVRQSRRAAHTHA